MINIKEGINTSMVFTRDLQNEGLILIQWLTQSNQWLEVDHVAGILHQGRIQVYPCGKLKL